MKLLPALRPQTSHASLNPPGGSTPRPVHNSTRDAEWAALQVEVEGGLVGLREGREHRRLFQRLLADFEATLQPPVRRVVQQRRRAPRLSDIVAGAR